MTLTVRPARPTDAEALAGSWLEGARELVDVAPELFRLPDPDGLVEFIRKDLERLRSDVLSLVADHDGEVVGSLEARLIAPVESAEFQVMKNLSQPRVYVDHLRILPQSRRRGVASELLTGAERWGLQHGAASIALDTFA